MGDYQSVDKEIDALESMLKGGSFSDTKPNWSAVWGQIRTVGQSFKGIRYPTRQAHDHAWNRFQSLVADVKHRQAREREHWQRNKAESARLRDRIIAQAKDARPSTGIEDLIMFLATGGVSAVLNTILDRFDERKRELQEANRRLRAGWDMLGEYKADMLGRDKQEAFRALNDAKENLDHEWDVYKRERQKAFEAYQADRRQRQEAHQARREAWRERIEANIRKLEEREESNIEDIRSKLRSIETWLYEERSKLSS